MVEIIAQTKSWQTYVVETLRIGPNETEFSTRKVPTTKAVFRDDGTVRFEGANRSAPTQSITSVERQSAADFLGLQGYPILGHIRRSRRYGPNQFAKHLTLDKSYFDYKFPWFDVGIYGGAFVGTWVLISRLTFQIAVSLITRLGGGEYQSKLTGDWYDASSEWWWIARNCQPIDCSGVKWVVYNQLGHTLGFFLAVAVVAALWWFAMPHQLPRGWAYTAAHEFFVVYHFRNGERLVVGADYGGLSEINRIHADHLNAWNEAKRYLSQRASHGDDGDYL